MPMFAEIAVNVPVLNTTYHYHVPAGMAVLPGHLVQVAFRTAWQHGIVVALHAASPVPQTKPVEALLYPEPLLTEDQIALAHWISSTYYASLASCLWMLLPPGIGGERDHLVSLAAPDAVGEDPVQQQIIALLRRRGEMRAVRIGAALKDVPAEVWRGALERLSKRAVINKQPVLLPPRQKAKSIQTAALTIDPGAIEQVAPTLGKTSRQADLLEMIAGTPPTDLKTLAAALGATKATLQKMLDEGLLAQDDAGRVTLALPVDALPETLIRLRRAEQDRHILYVLAREPDALDVSWVYAQTGATLADLKRLEDAEVIALGEKPVWRDTLAGREFGTVQAPPLTAAQASVWAVVQQALEAATVPPQPPAPPPHPYPLTGLGAAPAPSSPPVFLLHGVTGSGKTEIYLRAIEHTLDRGRAAIFLVPEIALTPQTIRRVMDRFSVRFPGNVALLHSGLSAGERYDTWQRAKAGQVRVIVGARSALFAPLRDIGLIVLDECHDHSYKQSPNMDVPPHVSAPHYDARAVAEAIAHRSGAVLLLGSATPDVETYYRAAQNGITLLHLPERILGHREHIQQQAEQFHVQPRYQPGEADSMTIDLPPVQIVDMRDELKAGNTSMFSLKLHTALAETLERGEQAILFLNRRGQATYVFCRDCGYVARCPNCDTALTFHREGEALRCHHCGYEAPPPQTCPQCASRRIRFFGAGTQQVEQALHDAFPGVRAVRWDADTAHNPAMHDVILQQFTERHAQVMIGTQMVAKGLDLPLVTLVGVVSADLGLALPDFRAAERTFQLLTQVAGRAGRGVRGGQVILQTYQPGSDAIAAASRHDYAAFYAREIIARRELGYPPFRRMVRVVVRDEREAHARREAERAAQVFRAQIARLKLTDTELIGPAPCFFTRLNKQFRWHLLLRGPDPARALEGIDFEPGWYVDVDPLEVL